ncbi:uncharacterized protein OCT59_024288 [Rhizophagus irregularis]|uniref:uncharacterized protein n=1 Tax=Rhizophagus irregularis TaxID=588596 RepID=UPI00331D15C6|nr:hypothetical protein OCT59_024288 [Rhizophagus irregularis]
MKIKNGSFKLFWETFWRFFCISCDDQAFGRMKFPMTGQAFGCVKFPMTGQAFGCVKFSKMSRPFDMFCKVSNSRIGYWNLEMKGFDWVPGDWRRSRRTDCFLEFMGLFRFKEKFHFFGFFQITIAKHVYQIILFSDTFIHFI